MSESVIDSFLFLKKLRKGKGSSQWLLVGKGFFNPFKKSLELGFRYGSAEKTCSGQKKGSKKGSSLWLSVKKGLFNPSMKGEPGRKVQRAKR